MKTRIMALAATVGILTVAIFANAEKRATKQEAEAMVKKAVAHYKSNGEKALADFTAPSKKFVSKDIYIVVYDITGKCLAHGQNAARVGKDQMGMRDPDGKPFIQERLELTLIKNSFWQYYKFTDPITQKVLHKQMYCEKADNKAIVCGGVYRQ
jgi:cytochrome c